jgi:hypothetical protein
LDGRTFAILFILLSPKPWGGLQGAFSAASRQKPIDELEAGKGTSFTSVDELMTDLRADD